jgi:hypothetical protein
LSLATRGFASKSQRSYFLGIPFLENKFGEIEIMKTFQIIILILTVTVSLFAQRGVS